MGKLKFIALKEIYHIMRDPRSLAVVFAMPILMAFLYGYAINLDINNVELAVADFDHSTESHDLIEEFRRSAYFTVEMVPPETRDFEELIRTDEAHAVLFIRPDFGKSLERGEQVSLGLTIDGSDATTAYAVQSYSEGVVNRFVASRLTPGTTLPGVEISRQVLYNADLRSAVYFVPGLVAVILMLISALLTSITIAREKETGTMEQLLTAPVKPWQILVGKLLPYVGLAFVDGLVVLLFAWLLFDVPFVGSELLLLVFGFIYITTALCIGILISSLVKTQQVAMMIALTATMLPSVLLSGFVFATKNFPIALQVISHIVPARYFVTIIRGIMLKGAGVQVLATHALALVGLMLLMLFVSAKKFKARID